jgi:hypothetical protein
MPTPTSGSFSLDRAVVGEYSNPSPKDGVYALARSGLPDAAEQLAMLVRDEGRLDLRRRAALALSKFDDAREVLLRLVEIREPAVLATVLLALARVGEVEDLDVIRRAASGLSGHAAEQAQFAQLLLAYRLGLDSAFVPPIVIRPEIKAPIDARPVSMGSPAKARNACLVFTSHAHLGFEPDLEQSVLIHCGHSDTLLIPSISLRSAKRLSAARMVLGATASYEREAGVWRHDLWIFSAPANVGIELQAWTLGGRACYTGHGSVVDEVLTFELVTGASSPLAIARLHGQLSKESISIAGVVGDRPASDARRPTPLERPSDSPRR